MKDHITKTIYPDIITNYYELVMEYVGTLLFFSFLVMVFFMPLFETWKNVGFCFALFFWAVKVYVSRDFKIKLYPLGWGFLALLAVGFISTLFALEPYQGFRGLWDIFRYSVVYLLVVNTFETEQQIRLCVAVLLLSVAVGCLWGLSGYYFGSEQFLEINSLGHKNHTATYLAIILSLCGGLFATNSRYEMFHLFLFGVMVLAGWALLLTQARAAWIALSIVYATFLYLMKKRRAWLNLGVFIIFFIMMSLALQPVRARWATLLQSPTENEALLIRARSWKNTLSVVRDHPLLGVGPRNFDFIEHERYDLVGWNHAHSLYINTTAEMGVLGLGALLGWIAGCWMTLGRLRERCLTADQLGYWLGALGALLVVLTSGVVATTMHTEGAMALSLLLGISVSATRMRDGRLEATRGGFDA